MGALQAYRARLPKPVVYTVGLAALGAVYPAFLFRYETVPSLEAMDPFLAMGALVGFALDRLLAPGDLAGIANGEVRSTRLWSTSTRLAASAPSGLRERWIPAAAAHVEEWSTDDGGASESADEDDDSGLWWLVSTLVSSVGLTWVVQFTAAWFVGVVLGMIWTLVAIRVVRHLSPFAEG